MNRCTNKCVTCFLALPDKVDKSGKGLLSKPFGLAAVAGLQCINETKNNNVYLSFAIFFFVVLFCFVLFFLLLHRTLSYDYVCVFLASASVTEKRNALDEQVNNNYNLKTFTSVKVFVLKSFYVIFDSCVNSNVPLDMNAKLCRVLK